MNGCETGWKKTLERDGGGRRRGGEGGGERGRGKGEGGEGNKEAGLERVVSVWTSQAQVEKQLWTMEGFNNLLSSLTFCTASTSALRTSSMDATNGRSFLSVCVCGRK